ncbi:sulfite oxidase heme-binding subunit YedZ [Chloroflexota bacterium]
MKKNRFTPFQIVVHISSLIPLGLLIWDYFTNNLTFNPIQEATLRTGKTAIVLLVLSIAATPLNTLFKFRQALKVRSALGLYTFFFAALHGLIFIGADYGFNWSYIKEALFEKRFALIGMLAFLAMLPLAITSTDGWKKRLKQSWKRLHRLAYLAGILAVIHFTWLVKSDIREPLVYGLIVLLLLTLRIPAIRRWSSNLKLDKMFPRNLNTTN